MEGIITKELSPYDRDDLARSLLRSIRGFYSDPANVARFERWKKEKEGRESGTQAHIKAQ